MKITAKQISEILHEVMVVPGVVGCPEMPNIKLGQWIKRMLARHYRGDHLSDVITSTTMRLLTNDRFKGIPHIDAVRRIKQVFYSIAKDAQYWAKRSAETAAMSKQCLAPECPDPGVFEASPDLRADLKALLDASPDLRALLEASQQT